MTVGPAKKSASNQATRSSAAASAVAAETCGGPRKCARACSMTCGRSTTVVDSSVVGCAWQAAVAKAPAGEAFRAAERSRH